MYSTYHIINILPIIKRDKLEGGQHGPEEVVKVRVPMVGIRTHT